MRTLKSRIQVIKSYATKSQEASPLRSTLQGTPRPNSAYSSPLSSPKIILEPKIIERSDSDLIKLHPVPMTSSFLTTKT
jgi:hypothetical protein